MAFDTSSTELDVATPEPRVTNLVLFDSQSQALPLTAYLASALTGLGDEQRQLIFTLSDTIAQLCSEFDIELYEPRKATDPVHHSDVSSSEVFHIDRDRVQSSDLLIHLAHYPSTGAGEELDFAYNALVPVMLISHGETRVSRMIKGIPALKVEIVYSEPEELRSALRDALSELRPVLEERKLAFSEYDKNIVGDKIRRLREEMQLSREEVATAIRGITVDSLTHLEQSSDRLSNPSLVQLRQLAAILKTTVADLVEPNLGEQVVAALHDWLTDRESARYGISVKDRNRLLRRVLYRVMDSLEDDET